MRPKRRLLDSLDAADGGDLKRGKSTFALPNPVEPCEQGELESQLMGALETEPSVGAALDALNLGFMHMDPRFYEDSQDQEPFEPDVKTGSNQVGVIEESKNKEHQQELLAPTIPVTHEKVAPELAPETVVPAPVASSLPSRIMSDQEKKRDLHRENSRRWHEKYISKGKPRNPESENPAPPAESLSGSSSSKPMTSLQKARDEFVASWIQSSGMPKSNERYKAACKAWMDSSVRADIISGRSGVQK